MTSRNLFFKLMREDFKRRLWVVALIGMGCFFAFPVSAAFMAGSIEDAVTYERGLAIYTSDLLELLSFDAGFTVFGMVIAALICGLSSFSYLNSKSKVDFYHGIPVRREKMFAANFLNGILMLAVPYGICVAAAAVVGISNGVNGGLLWPVALSAFVLHLIYYILMYATVVIAAMMTGNLIVGFLGSMVFAVVIPLAVALIQGYFVLFYHSFAKDIEASWYQWGVRMSPLMEYIYQVSQYNEGKSVTVAAAVAVALSAVLAAIGCFLYRKRPSEAAGRAMAFPVSRPVICILLTMVSAAGMGAFFWGVRESMGWAVFGVLCGAVICHCVVQIIYHFDFKKLFSCKLQLAGCIVAALGMLCIFRYDVTGYDRYLPSAGNVKSAAIDVVRLDRWASYETLELDKDGAWHWNYEDSNDYVLEHMEYTDVENLLKIAEAGILQLEKNREEKEAKISGSGGQETMAVSVIGGADGPTSIFVAGKLGNEEEEKERIEHWSTVLIRYTLNSGREVYRQYNICLEDVIPEIERLMTNQQYLQGTYPVMNRSGDDIAVIRYRAGVKETLLDQMTAEEKKELLLTYQKEFAGMTMTEMYDQAPVGLIRFTSSQEEDAMAWMRRQKYNLSDTSVTYSSGQYRYNYDGYYIEGDNRDYYPVYPSFTRTLELLANHDVDAGAEFDGKEVESICVTYDKSYMDRSNDTWVRDVSEAVFSDSEEIAELSDVLVDSARTYYNPLYCPEEEIDVTVSFVENGISYERNALFPKGKIPAFVEPRLKKVD